MDEYRELARRVMIAVNTIDGLYYLSARKLGIKSNELSLLYALNDDKAHSQKEICEEWLIPKTTINTIVKECIDKGYITFQEEKHSREKLIVLTEKGREYADAILSEYCRSEDEAMKRTVEEFSPEFVKIMEKFAVNLKEEFQNRLLRDQ